MKSPNEPSDLNEVRDTGGLALQKSLPRVAWSRLKVALTVGSIVGLVITNLMSLLNSGFHQAGFDLISSTAARLLPTDVSERLLKNSPTVRRKMAVQKATGDLNRRLAALSQSHSNLAGKHARLAARLERLATKHLQLAEGYDVLQRRQIETLRKARERKQIVSRISKRMTTRGLSSATRNVASIPAEAIPIAGVTILVGVSALDLADACKMMKDADELAVTFGDERNDQDRDYVCGLRVPTRKEVLDELKKDWQAAYKKGADVIAETKKSFDPPSLGEMVDYVCPIVGSVPGLCNSE